MADQRGDAVGPRDVAGREAGVQAQRVEVGQHLGAARGVQVRQHQARAAAGQRLRGGKSDTARRAGDQHRFAA